MLVSGIYTYIYYVYMSYTERHNKMQLSLEKKTKIGTPGRKRNIFIIGSII